MKFNADLIEIIHEYLIEAFRIERGYKDKNALNSICDGMESHYNGQYLFPTVFEKSAYLFEGIIRLHPFIDGNKRTALASVGAYLLINGYLFITPLSAVRFTIKVAGITDLESNSIQLLRNDIVKWIKFRTVNLRNKKISYQDALKVLEMDSDMIKKINEISDRRHYPDLLKETFEYWIGADIYPDSKDKVEDIYSYYDKRKSEIMKFIDAY